MKRRRLARHGLLALLLLASPAVADLLPEDFDEYVLTGLREWKAPGLALGIFTKEGEPILRGYGVREQGKPGKVGPETLFAIGSTSKAFTAAALGTLVDAGRLGWDTRVAQVWPGFKLSDPWVTEEIRVSDLLANHSGLSLLSEALWYGTGFSREEILQRLAHIPFESGFRYQFQYRNVMFLAAGELIPQLTGQSWEAYLTEHLFTPLGMSRTTPTEVGWEQKTDVARPHLIGYDGEPRAIAYRPMGNIAPAGSIFSCVRDLLPWLELHLSQGSFRGKALLKPETVAFMHRSQTPLSTTGPAGQPLSPPTQLPAYALGWVTESYRGERIVWHNGGIDGMSAWIGLLPERGVGVAMLTNLDECDLRKAIFYKIVDAVLGQPSTDLAPGLLKTHRAALAARDAAEATWQKLPPTVPEPARYTGRYTHPALGEVELVEKDGTLLYRRTPQQTLELRPTPAKAHTFEGRYREPGEDLRSGKVALAFTVEEGRAVAFTEEGILTFQRVP